MPHHENARPRHLRDRSIEGDRAGGGYGGGVRSHDVTPGVGRGRRPTRQAMAIHHNNAVGNVKTFTDGRACRECVCEVGFDRAFPDKTIAAAKVHVVARIRRLPLEDTKEDAMPRAWFRESRRAPVPLTMSTTRLGDFPILFCESGCEGAGGGMRRRGAHESGRLSSCVRLMLLLLRLRLRLTLRLRTPPRDFSATRSSW